MNKKLQSNTPPWLTDSDELPLSKSLREAITPSRRHPGKAHKVDIAKIWENFRQTLLEHAPSGWLLQNPDDELAAAWLEAAALLQQPELPVARDAAWAILLRRTLQWSTPLPPTAISTQWRRHESSSISSWQACVSASELFGQLCSLLLARLGCEHTLAIVLQALTFRLELLAGQVDFSRNFFYEVAAQQDYYAPTIVHVLTADPSLRTALAQIDEASWQRCASLIRQTYQDQHPFHRIYLLWLLPDCKEWVKAEILAICQNTPPRGQRSDYWLVPLISVAPDRETVAALRACRAMWMADSHFASLLHWAGVRGMPPDWGELLPDMVAQLGMAALPELIQTQATPVVSWLGSVNHELALRKLAELSGNDSASYERFSKACQRWPLLALRVIAEELLAISGKKPAYMQTWRALLVTLLRQNPQALQELQPWVCADIHAYLGKLEQGDDQAVNMASANELPALLVNPPWLGKQVRNEIPVLAIEPLPLAPIERWSEAHKQELLVPPQQYLHSSFMESRYRHKDVQDAIADGVNTASVLKALGFNKKTSAGYGQPALSVEEHEQIELSYQAMLAALQRQDITGFLASWTQAYAAKHTHSREINPCALPLLSDEQSLYLWNEETVGWRVARSAFPLAYYGVRALPGLLWRALTPGSDYLHYTLYFGTIELARPMARKYRGKVKSQRDLARQWLLAYPEHTITALLPVALGAAGEARDEARLALRLLLDNGQADLLRQCAARYQSAEVTAALETLLAADPLDNFPSKIGKAPPYCTPQSWRRPLLAASGKALPDSALEHLATMLRFPVSDGRYAGLEVVKALCTTESLADFVWDAFDSWLLAGSPSKDSVIFQQLVPFASDDTARRLGVLVRQWSAAAMWARAISGLDMLAEIGSDPALLQINSLALSCKKQSMQDRAKEKIAQIAAERELSVPEMEDRLAPDLGLDDRGSLQLSFGERSFTVGFDEELQPFVRDEEGARLADLPKARKSDDAALAKAATARFKALKKDAKAIASQQICRLELAMCQRRRWLRADFEAFLAPHPLVRHLVQRLVWAAYPATEGSALMLFRVGEDGSYSDANDDPVCMPDGDIRIGLPHPIDLSAEAIAAFGQLFADYELLQPFPQLARPVYRLSAEERASSTLLRWQGKTTPAGRVLGLTGRRWEYGSVESGMYVDFVLRLNQGHTVRLDLSPGVALFDRDVSEVVTVEAVSLQMPREGTGFGQLDAISSSELIHELELLTR